MIKTGATLWGSNQTANAQADATNQQIASQNQSTQLQIDAMNQAQSNFETQQTQASPGLIALQNVVGRGSDLTAEQERALGDARRTTVDAISGGSLRGSAGATSAIIADVEGTMRDNYITQNQNRADSAGTLSNQYFSAGKNIAQNNINTGIVGAQGAISTGNVQATNTVVQDQIRGNAIGDISAVIADQVKKQTTDIRDSSYSKAEEGV